MPTPQLPCRSKVAGIRNRVVERVRMDVAGLARNARNWRRHPAGQREAMTGILADIGQVGELYAYRSERNDGKLTLIDGHLRTEIGGEWDVAITDLNDAEADKLLLTYDPLGAMAVPDKERLEALMRDVRTANESVATMLADLAQRNGIAPAREDLRTSRPEIPNRFAVLIECESENQQSDLLKRLTEEGLPCRSLIV
jgi:hypothetical protein